MRSAAILWNTTYLQGAGDHLRKQGHHPTPGDLAHLSPLSWEHIDLTGDYLWETSPTLGPDQFRPLSIRAHDLTAAAWQPPKNSFTFGARWCSSISEEHVSWLLSVG